MKKRLVQFYFLILLCCLYSIPSLYGQCVPNEITCDDGCDLTTDTLNVNTCLCDFIPPDVDDGCYFTIDYFDAENCIVVNEIDFYYEELYPCGYQIVDYENCTITPLPLPNCDDACDLTYDYFDSFECICISELQSCYYPLEEFDYETCTCIQIPEVLGCTDPTACNYNPDANTYDDSCIYGVFGCVDASACNYNADAECDDGTCLYISGCTNPSACNYNPNAQCDDGSCSSAEGCTDPSACNYDATAVCDDGSCILDFELCCVNELAKPNIEIEWGINTPSTHEYIYAIAPTNDGNFVVAGSPEYANGQLADFYIAKIDESGNILWEKVYGGLEDEECNDVIQTSDGGYIMVGYTQSTDGDVIASETYDGLAWVVKLDANGDLEWEHNYGLSNSGILRSVVESSDGYILAGAGVSDFLKIDLLGNIVWELDLGNNFIQQIIPATDGGYIGVGRSFSTDSDLYLIKVDENGNILWDHNYGGSAWDFGSSIVVAHDGGYIVAGESESMDGDVPSNSGNRDAWLLKIDLQGNLIWSKVYGTNDVEETHSIIQTSDGNYAIAGIKDLAVSNEDAQWIAKFDANGEFIWDIVYSGDDPNQWNFVFDIAEASDGDLIFVGSADNDNYAIGKLGERLNCQADAGSSLIQNDLSLVYCNNIPGFTSSGFNQNACYAQTYIVVNGAGEVVAQTDNGIFDSASLPYGDYTFYALNYQVAALSVDTLDTVDDLTNVCFDTLGIVITLSEPDCNDGCDLTTDSFDLENCQCVNEPTACDLTVETYDMANCTCLPIDNTGSCAEGEMSVLLVIDGTNSSNANGMEWAMTPAPDNFASVLPMDGYEGEPIGGPVSLVDPIYPYVGGIDSFVICLNVDSTYEFNFYETNHGQGWNGGTWSLSIIEIVGDTSNALNGCNLVVDDPADDNYEDIEYYILLETSYTLSPSDSSLSEFCNPSTPILGCTSPSACNYNPNANTDDGSCLNSLTDYTGTLTINGQTELPNLCPPNGEPEIFTVELELDPSSPPLGDNYIRYVLTGEDGVLSVQTSNVFDLSNYSGMFFGITAVVAGGDGFYFPLTVDFSYITGCYDIVDGIGITRLDELEAMFEDCISCACTDSEADNYNPDAFCDNDACIYDSVIMGCTNTTACNYEPDANMDDGSCILPDGCTNPMACNYDATANCDDGSCTLPNGCTDPSACNYDATATCDDETCVYTPDTCDDGCELTNDYYDESICLCVNEIPDVDDNCDTTIDYFDAALCQIFNTVFNDNCDDNNPNTNDSFDAASCQCVYEGLDDCSLTATTTSLERIWSENYSNYSIYKDMVITDDGNYVLVGDDMYSDEDVYVIKIDEDGNLLWEQTFGGSNLDFGSAITLTNDGGLLVAASSYSNDGDFNFNNTYVFNNNVLSSSDTWILKLDTNGNLEWIQN